MTSSLEAPIKAKIANDIGIVTPTWTEYFAQLTNGDVGTSFTPTFSNLSSTGIPTISGVYYQNQGFTDFYVKIVPATDTTSVAGTTSFIVPFTVSADAGCWAIQGAGAGIGAVNATSQTVFPPSWTAATVPITISGRVKN